VNYFGLDDEYVMSGSDDGILFICTSPSLFPATPVSNSFLFTLTNFIGDRKTSGIVQLLKADTQVTNVMTGHPYHPILAASGIDHTVKIFSPEGLGKGLFSQQSLHDEYKIRTRNEVSRKNELHGTFLTRDMLEALAMNIRRGRIVRAGGGDGDGPGECHTQ
jgi:DDB1- and CUL4-associated factor 6